MIALYGRSRSEIAVFGRGWLSGPPCTPATGDRPPPAPVEDDHRLRTITD
jgi:hypothetical protein